MLEGRLLMNGPIPGDYAMALDRILMDSVEKTGKPVLRFYSWDRPTVSLGCFQKQYDVVRKAEEEKIRIVVRPTGGRGILHLPDELTYAIILPVALLGSSEKTVGTVEASRKIGEGLIRALRSLGLRAHLERRQRGRGVFRAALAPAMSCWAGPSECEVVDDQGRKWIGSAQRRSGSVILQHGSIPRSFPQVQWERIFGEGALPNPPVTDVLVFDHLPEAIRKGLSESLGIDWRESEVTEKERRAAEDSAASYHVNTLKGGGER